MNEKQIIERLTAIESELIENTAEQSKLDARKTESEKSRKRSEIELEALKEKRAEALYEENETSELDAQIGFTAGELEKCGELLPVIERKAKALSLQRERLNEEQDRLSAKVARVRFAVAQDKLKRSIEDYIIECGEILSIAGENTGFLSSYRRQQVELITSMGVMLPGIDEKILEVFKPSKKQLEETEWIRKSFASMSKYGAISRR